MFRRIDPVKAYLITTGILFGVLALAHLVLTIAEWSRLAAEPGFAVQGPGIGLVAVALCLWAWLLHWRLPGKE
jgi:hypothetical protein